MNCPDKFVFVLEKFGRVPDLDKWLRPRAFCPTCDEWVDAMQVFKKPGNDMGRYGKHGQYVYRCPRVSCRNQIIEPEVLPAAAAIDWTLPPGQKIGERVDKKGQPDPLEPATIARIVRGLERYGRRPMLSPAGGTWRNEPSPLDVPMPARTTRDNDALVCPPLLVPTTGREGKQATPADRTLPTQTCRRELAVVIPPFITSLRGGGSKKSAREVGQPLATFAASGFHHGLVMAPGAQDVRWGDLVVPYYSNSQPYPVDRPLGTVPTVDRFGLLGTGDGIPDVNECTFRMLEIAEIAAGMAFDPDYEMWGSKRDRARGLGNAVPPPVAEVLMSALMEAVSGESLS